MSKILFRDRKFKIVCLYAFVLSAAFLFTDKLDATAYSTGMALCLAAYGKEVFSVMFGKRDAGAD